MRDARVGGFGCVAAIIVGALLAAGCGSSGQPRADTTSVQPRPEIVFVSTRGGEYAIYGMNADGSREQRLTPGEKGDGSSPQRLFLQDEPAWSPDGRVIAFASMRDGRAHIFVMRPDGSGTRRLTSTGSDDAHPTWSPDGGRIAFARGSPGDIHVMAADGSDVRRVGSDSADERHPAWSPDGRWIAYVQRQTGTPIREIWLVRPDGSGRRQLTRLNAASYSPAWSPDGQRIAFSSNARGGIWAIYTISVDGKGLRQVTRSAADAFEPTWSPDGKTIAFSRDGSIYALDSAGREHDLTEGENDSYPAWRPQGGQAG